MNELVAQLWDGHKLLIQDEFEVVHKFAREKARELGRALKLTKIRRPNTTPAPIESQQDAWGTIRADISQQAHKKAYEPSEPAKEAAKILSPMERYQLLWMSGEIKEEIPAASIKALAYAMPQFTEDQILAAWLKQILHEPRSYGDLLILNALNGSFAAAPQRGEVSCS